MRFVDFVTSGTNDEFVTNLNNIGNSLSNTAASIKLEDKSDILACCICNLVQYSAEQLSRLAKMITDPIEYQAWAARNLFEATLLIEYLIQNPNAANNFISQKATDEIEIYEGMLSINTDMPSLLIQPMLDRIQHIERTLEKHSFKKTKPWTTSWLASQTKNENEYKAFFKLYSKYVHPSSWIVLSVQNEIDTTTYRNVFLIQSQYYASRIHKLARDYCKVHNQK